MPRQLDTATLDGAAQTFARHFGMDSIKPDGRKKHTEGLEWVLESLYDAHFRDEHDYIVQAMLDGWLPAKLKPAFEAEAKKRFVPREDVVYEAMLMERLAISPAGDHVDGSIGRVQIGQRYIGMAPMEVEAPASIRYRKWMRSQGRDPGPRQTIIKILPRYWPVYAGETEERSRPEGVADPLPLGADPWPVGLMHALAPTWSYDFAEAGLNAGLDLFDEGSAGGVIKFYTASKPADPDVAVTGQTLLATCTFSTTAFGAAVDDTPHATATAAAITGDTSADATGTAAWARASSSNDGTTALDDHGDGSVGTSNANYVMNTTSFVSGSTVDITAMTATQSQGATAT